MIDLLFMKVFVTAVIVVRLLMMAKYQKHERSRKPNASMPSPSKPPALVTAGVAYVYIGFFAGFAPFLRCSEG